MALPLAGVLLCLSCTGCGGTSSTRRWPQPPTCSIHLWDVGQHCPDVLCRTEGGEQGSHLKPKSTPGLGVGPSSGVINHLVCSWPAPAVRQKLRVDDHGGNFIVYLLQSPGFNTRVMQNLPQVKPNGYWIHSETRVPWIHCEISLGSIFHPNGCFCKRELILWVAKECGWNTC